MGSFEILKWDSYFFGFNTAIINDKCVSARIFDKLYQSMKNKKVKLIYWPSDINCISKNEISKKYNGSLVDIKTTYEKILEKNDGIISENQLSSVEFFKNMKPTDRILEIAVQCGEYSRFKVDPDFPDSKFTELYKTWVIKSLTGDLADEVIVTKKDDNVTGLITVKCRDGIGSISLVGVHEKYRGTGHGGILIEAALKFFNEKKCYKAQVITQGMNKNACKLYEKYGFKVNTQVNFYHFWVR